MRHRSRAVALALASLAVVGGANPETPADVTVVVTGLRNDRGVVRACMTRTAERFPNCDSAATSYNAVTKAAGGASLTFRDVKPGRYAIALLHDENGNGKADRAAMMIPTEGFGFSRDAKVRFGPPRFDAAAFDVAAGSSERIAIRMRYML